MDYGKKSNFTFFNYNINEHELPEKYQGEYTVSLRNGNDLEKSLINNPEYVSAVIDKDNNKILNPLFTYDRNSVHTGEGVYEKYVNAYGLELLYDVKFGYDGHSFEIMYRNPRELQLWVDEGDGWKILFENYQVGHNEDVEVSLKITFGEEGGYDSKSYKMRRFRLRTTGWFGGIIRDKTCSIVKSISLKAPLAVFEGTSITESCNEVSPFNAYSYARILSDIYGFEYLCLAQGGTGISRPAGDRPSMLDRIDGVLKAQPDILFMEVGINDQDDDKLKNNTELYLKTIREKLPQTLVIMIGTYCPNNLPEDYAVRRKNDVITSEICKNYGIPFIEIANGKVYGANGELIADMVNPLIVGSGKCSAPDGTGTADRYTGRYGSNDGCHCNPRAYRMFAEYLRSCLNAIFNSYE